MDRKTFDNLVVKCIGNKHIKLNTCYYDEEYEKELIRLLEYYDLKKNFSKELKLNSKGRKMCSIASSSRLGFLASRSLYQINQFEKINLTYGCCIPNYDAFDWNNNVFYEFKSHEFCDESHHKFTNSYLSIFKEVFGINIDDVKNLKFSDFKINIKNNPSIYNINFDFKQFICHILGILSHEYKENEKKPTLKYVWFVPYLSDDNQKEELDDFIEKIENQMVDIFNQTSELYVTTNYKKGKIKEFVDFNYDIIPIVNIDDFILAGLKD